MNNLSYLKCRGNDDMDLSEEDDEELLDHVEPYEEYKEVVVGGCIYEEESPQNGMATQSTISDLCVPLKKVKYKSKTAVALHTLFGNDELIMQFDRCKQSNHNDEIFKVELQNIISKLDVKLINCMCQLKADFNVWEKKWFIENNLKSINLQDVENDTHANEIRNKINICRALQNHFGGWKF